MREKQVSTNDHHCSVESIRWHDWSWLTGRRALRSSLLKHRYPVRTAKHSFEKHYRTKLGFIIPPSSNQCPACQYGAGGRETWCKSFNMANTNHRTLSQFVVCEERSSSRQHCFRRFSPGSPQRNVIRPSQGFHDELLQLEWKSCASIDT